MIFNNNLEHDVPKNQYGEDALDLKHSDKLHPSGKPGESNKSHPPIISEKPEGPGKPQPPVRPERPVEEMVILVNGVDKIIPKGINKLSYEEIVKLAYGEYVNSDRVIYTVVYSNGPVENRKGTMVKGSIVIIRKGMIFNVGRSDKS